MRVGLILSVLAGCAPQRSVPTETRGPAEFGTPASNSEEAPRTLPPSVARGLLSVDPSSPPHVVKLPPEMAARKASWWCLVKICVSPEGTVTHARVVRSTDASVDHRMIDSVSRWRYRSYVVDGKAVPFCYIQRYEVSVR
jgi:hypothetical protein